jgi:hypothetical protein
MKAFDYFRAELLRFRGWALAFFALHTVVLLFLTRVVDLAQQPLSIYQAFGGSYLVCGLLLGAYQMGQYRRPNAWLNLLHRPVDPRQLAGALMAAAAVLLLVGVLLPIGVAALWQATMTPRVLDARHLGLASSGWLLAVSGYLIGAYAMLANRRYAVAGFIFLTLFGNAAAIGLGATGVQLAVLAWLAAMVLACFKPDLAAAPRGLAATTAVAAPLQMAMWFALVLLTFGVELLWIMQGSHPNNLPVPIPGSAKEADNAEGRDLMIAGLKASPAADAPLWIEQARISEVYTTGPGLGDLPVRGEYTNAAPLEFDDDAHRLRWVFSHDDMRFHGYTLADHRPAGVLGIGGNAAFPQPPLPAGKGLLVTRTGVYQYDEEARRILARARVPAGEQVTGLDEAGERIVLVSDRAVYLYDARDLQASDGLLRPRLRVPLPERAGRLSRIDLMELLDGVLVSFTYTRNVYKGEGRPYQVLLRADEAGAVQPVARRALSSGYGTLWMHSSWYFSPVLWELQHALTRVFAAYRVEFDVVPPPRPRSAWIVAGLLSAVSLLGAAWRARRIDASPAAKSVWLGLCVLVGLPALMAFWLLYPPRERLDHPAARPSAAGA